MKVEASTEEEGSSPLLICFMGVGLLHFCTHDGLGVIGLILDNSIHTNMANQLAHFSLYIMFFLFAVRFFDPVGVAWLWNEIKPHFCSELGDVISLFMKFHIENRSLSTSVA